jgi:hypothetical protein
MILSIGSITYKEDALAVLSHYFKSHNIEYHVIENAPPTIDVRGSHPSWWKLLAHSILPGYDFILCWDLDLLPNNPDVNIIDEFNMNLICLSWDSHAKHYPNDKFLPSFKYNGGLLGIPKSYKDTLESIFKRYAPGIYPSYKAYLYLNFHRI